MPAGALEGKRVLIAEDSWHIAFALKIALEGEGAVVVGPAPTVAKACSLLDGEDVDLGLIDVSLRDEMAYPLLAALAARGIRSVVLSGHRDIRGLDGNTVAVLAKPVEAERLLRTVRSVLSA